MWGPMGAALKIEVVRPTELNLAERRLWQSFRGASPHLASPYFDLRYALAAGASAPEAQVAILHRRGAIAGFFPFQKRRGAIQPLGAPLTDYHGVLAAPGEAIDLHGVVKALGGGDYRFTGLAGADGAGASDLTRHRAMIADLGGGFDAYIEGRQAAHPRFFKGRRRNVRAIERDLGPLDFTWSRRDDELLDYIIAMKRAQYRRTGQHDIFACGWTERMVREIGRSTDPDFGLGLAVLRAGDWIVSAEAALISGGAYHLWLPVYEPGFARYGPGMLMTLRTLEAVAAAGVTQVGFGRDDADYKAYFADPADTVLEGVLPGHPLSLSLAALADKALAGPRLRKLASLRGRVRRRFDVITACETNHWGWACGAALAVGLMVQGTLPAYRINQPTPRRPDAQRAYSRLDGPAEGRVSHEADDVRASVA